MQERRCHLKQPPFSNMFSQVFTFPAPHTGDRHKRLALLSSSGVAEPCFLASYPMNMQAVFSLITCLRLIFPLIPESSSAQMVTSMCVRCLPQSPAVPYERATVQNTVQKCTSFFPAASVAQTFFISIVPCLPSLSHAGLA